MHFETCATAVKFTFDLPNFAYEIQTDEDINFITSSVSLLDSNLNRCTFSIRPLHQ